MNFEMEDPRPILTRKQAKENLDLAIRDCVVAFGQSDGMLVDWVVLTAQHHVHDDGRESTGQMNITRTNQPVYRSVGLLLMAADKARGIVSRGGNPSV